MKSMKLASVAMLAMVGLGFASPASAAVGVDESTATVTIQSAIGDNRSLILKSVPTAYNFETTLKESTYSMVSTTLTNSKIEVHKNYNASRVKEVRAKISALTVSSGGNNVTPTNFKINDIDVTGTGNSAKLYNDSDFHTTGPNAATSGTLSKAITSAEISFTRTGLKVNNTLTGTITYEIGNYTPAS